MTENNNIENPFNASNPFKTCNDYFESFNSKLQSHIDSFEEIKTIAPILSNIPKYNPFEVPANYFDELPTLVQQRVNDTKSSTSIMEWLVLLIKPRFAVPVIITVFIAIAGIDFMNNNAQLPETAEEITVEEQLYNIDEAMIIETLMADATTDDKNVPEEDNSIENYLIDNDIDETNLNPEL